MEKLLNVFDLTQNQTINIILLLTVFLVVFCGSLIVLNSISIHRKKKKNRELIYSGNFLYYKEFEENWIISRGSGLKYEDGPGCYVITIYNHPVTDGNFSNYDNIYIGQSVNVFKRVHDHIKGKGNGDVYADIKYGKQVYIRFVRCKKESLNSVEKNLIASFNSTASYNKTKGGAKKR